MIDKLKSGPNAEIGYSGIELQAIVKEFRRAGYEVENEQFAVLPREAVNDLLDRHVNQAAKGVNDEV